MWLFSLDVRAYNHGLKGPQKPKTYCDNSSFAILSLTPILTVRLGPVWRQDLAILSPDGPRNSTCQLRPWVLFWGVPPSPLAVLQAGCLDRAGLVWSFCIAQTDPQKNPRNNAIGANMFTGRKNALCPKIRDFPRKWRLLEERPRVTK